MTEEEGIFQANEQSPTIQDNSPQTLETGTLQETNQFSKEENKTISSINHKTKKNKKPCQLNIESRNSTKGFENKYRKTSRTESYK